MDKISRVPSRRGGGKTLSISKKKKAIKVKKIDKKGQPLKGVEFKMYANKEDALNDKNILDIQTTNKDGIATFENDIYYGRYIKESKTNKNYQIRNKEKDIIPVEIDNGVRFLGEMTPDTMSFIKKDKEGKVVENNNPGKYNNNINTYLQSLVYEGYSFNDSTNWLVFNDNGTEKLVAKKPLKWGISWDELYDAKVVFGQKEKPEDYIPTEITINGKKYIVRLIRAYNDDTPINDRSFTFGQYDRVKGSEWNRLILPLIDPTGDDNNEGWTNGTNGRYGSRTKHFVESNMPVIANYSWWTDFGGNSGGSGEYEKGNDYGIIRWAQEISNNDSSYRICRGGYTIYFGAATVYSSTSHSDYNNCSWLPVLERVDK